MTLTLDGVELELDAAIEDEEAVFAVLLLPQLTRERETQAIPLLKTACRQDRREITSYTRNLLVGACFSRGAR